MKYIDSEKLKAEIERLKEPNKPYLSDFENGCIEGCNNVLDDILSIITSLQQEQPEVDLKKEIQSFWNENALAYRLGHVADINFLAYTARHFYELGQRTKYQQDRGEFAKLKAKEWQEGYENGYLKAIDDIRKGFKGGSSEKPNDQDAMRELDEKIALVKKNGSWDGVDVDEFMSEMRGH